MSSRLPSVIDDRQESSVSYENSISNTNDMPLEVDSELIHKSVINMRFPVYIESMTGITFRVDVFPSDTINQIKQQLENTEGIPVSQQHLIWHYKELIDDKTIDDYGIGFGAQMRLVIGLITGPVFRSPDVYDKRDDIKDDIYESKPFLNTLLLLQNLDQIKVISIASEDNMSGNESEVKTRTNESGDQLSETLDFEKLNLREKEDIEMKQKVNEIQTKLLFKRNANKMHSKQLINYNNGSNETTNVSKLPHLGTNQGDHLLKTDSVRGNAGIHLPKISNTSKSSGNSSHESTKCEKQFNLTKQTLMSLNDTKSISSNRRHSSQPHHRLLHDKEVNRLALMMNVTNNSLPRRRPLTAPIVKKINERDINLRNRLSITESYIRTDLLFKQNSTKTTKRLNSSKRLPMISSTSKKSTAKRIRCSQCRIKLAIVNRFHCRCGLIFCAKHRYSETHLCSYDYKEEGKRYLIQNNPMISAEKLPKI